MLQLGRIPDLKCIPRKEVLHHRDFLSNPMQRCVNHKCYAVIAQRDRLWELHPKPIGRPIAQNVKTQKDKDAQQ